MQYVLVMYILREWIHKFINELFHKLNVAVEGFNKIVNINVISVIFWEPIFIDFLQKLILIIFLTCLFSQHDYHIDIQTA